MEGTVPYANFRAWVPRKVLPVGTLSPHDWLYYEWGPREYHEPLVCLHGVVGSAESFFLQMLALAERGYRVLSVQLPVYWTTQEFCDGFHTFLDMVSIRRVHLYGAGLGGFLALQYASRRPERVGSVVLTHAFLSTEAVSQKIIYSPSILRWLPDVLVRITIRSLLPKGRASLPIAEAAEFSIVNTMSSTRDELASRLSVLRTPATVVGRIRIPEDSVTIIDVFEIATSSNSIVQEELCNAIPNARRAMIKSGGDFPYLASPDEVTVHLVVHLRRNAAKPVEPLSLPPPAKPRPLTYLRRNMANAAYHFEDPSGPKPVDIRLLAEERVALAEKQRNETYTFQLAQIRKYVSDHDDMFLMAVLDECEGNVDRAVQRIRDGQYKKNFHVKIRKRAIRHAMEDITKEQAEEQALNDTLEADVIAPVSEALEPSIPTGAHDLEPSSKENSGPVISQDPSPPLNGAVDVGNVDRAVQRIRDGQYKKNFHVKIRKRAIRHAMEDITKEQAEEQALNDTLEADVIAPVSEALEPSIPTGAHDLEPSSKENSGPVISQDPSPPLNGAVDVGNATEVVFDMRHSTQGSPESPEPGGWNREKGASVLGAALGRIMPNGLDIVALKESSTGRYSSNRKGDMRSEHGQLSDRSRSPDMIATEFSIPASAPLVDADGNHHGKPTVRRSSKHKSRSRYPPETDSISAYVTSEKVGMRTHDNLVGRGPAPFASSKGQESLYGQFGSGNVWSQGNAHSPVSSRRVSEASIHDSSARRSNSISSDDLPRASSQGYPDEYQTHGQGVIDISKSSIQNMGPDYKAVSERHNTSPLWTDVPILRVSTSAHGCGTEPDDGWSEFRRKGTPGISEATNTEILPAGSDEVGEDDDDSRMREWMLSAQAANEYVHRK